MIYLLFTVIFAEMALILLLLFKTPLRKLVILGLDRLKRNKGPIMVKTVAGTISMVLFTSVYSLMRFQKQLMDDGSVNPTDQILMAKYLLEATLMGAILFLALMVDRLHHYLRELRLRRKSMEAVKKQNRAFEEGKTNGSDAVKAMEEELSTLRTKLKQLDSELDKKTKDVKAAEVNTVALTKQSEGFLLEYDRLLEENQILRGQLQSLDRRFSRTGSKKNT